MFLKAFKTPDLYLIKSALHLGSTLNQNLLAVVRVDNSVRWGQGEDLELKSRLTTNTFLSKKKNSLD